MRLNVPAFNDLPAGDLQWWHMLCRRVEHAMLRQR
jgi:hypothetical protein